MARSSRRSVSISAPCHVRHGPSTWLTTPQLAVRLGPGRPSAITNSPTFGEGSSRRLAVETFWPASFKTARSRSEEHTSELQSQSNLVCRLLLEKKKKKKVHRETT